MPRVQRIILILYCLLLACCCVWVPWHVVQDHIAITTSPWNFGGGVDRNAVSDWKCRDLTFVDRPPVLEVTIDPSQLSDLRAL